MKEDLDSGHPIALWMNEVLEENFDILQQETDQDGNPLDILRIPVPPLTFAKGVRYSPSTLTVLRCCLPKDVQQHVLPSTWSKAVDLLLPMSYCNFLVTNGVVMMPRYFKAERARSELLKRTDSIARDILAHSFPGRQVVQIDTEALEYGGGGIHCSTQQQPFIITHEV